MVRIFTVILCFVAPALASASGVHAPVANSSSPLVATVPIELPAASEPALQTEREAEAERPTPVVESLPLGQGAPREEAAPAEAAEPGNTGLLQSPAVRTGGALTLVLSLIFAMRGLVQSAAKRGRGLSSALGPGGRAPSGVLSVLGRYPVGKGATLVLLQLDNRVLLLSQSGAGFSTLCEMTDPSDVASIVRKTADDEGSSLAKRFSSMLRRFESDPAMSDEGDSPVSPRRAMALRDYEAALANDDHAIAATPGSADSFSALQQRLVRLRDGVS